MQQLNSCLVGYNVSRKLNNSEYSNKSQNLTPYTNQQRCGKIPGEI